MIAPTKHLHLTGPVAYGYGRISHRDQEAKDSLDGQHARCLNFHKAMALQGLEVQWGGWFPEPGHVSARLIPFAERTVGKHLLATMKSGDHLIVDKLDRLWRDIHDYSTLLQILKQRKINLHIVNLMGATVSLGTPMGDFMLTMMVSIAQLESDMKSDRTKAALDHGMKAGFWKRNFVPPGCRVVGQKPRRRLVWDDEERTILGEIVRLYEEEGIGVRQITRIIEQKVCEANGRAFSTSAFHKSTWTHKRVRYAYVCEKHYRLVNDPMEVPWSKIPKMGWLSAKKLPTPGREVDNA